MSTASTSAAVTPARTSRLETVGYVLFAVLLAALLWRRTTAADNFYLDEWIYVHTGEYMWGNLPGALVGTIPEWTRGTQRLYPLLIGLPWSTLGTNAAFEVSHALNVLLLVSAIVPAALIARRVLEHPLLRVLAVVLAVGIPWLSISGHLLTENLAFPLFLWLCWAAVRVAESPTLGRQVVALAFTAGVVLCRTSLAPLFAVVLAAAVAGELLRRRDDHAGNVRWLAGALRRNWLLLAVTVLGVVFALRLQTGATDGSLGVYGNLGLDALRDRLFGDTARTARASAFTYGRALLQGGLVFPFAIGLAVALAGVFGRCGRRAVVPGAVALTGLVVLLATAAAFTFDGPQEERYVFYVYAPIALLAPVLVEQAARLRGWVLAGGAISIWLLVVGYAAGAANSGNFFATPSGAFWARVVDPRLRSWEERYLGWTLIPPTGWLLVALALVALVVFLTLTRRRPRLRTTVLVGGLALCAAAQLAILNYVYGQELYGTTDVAGGTALGPGHAGDRDDWVDGALPGDAKAAIVPGVSGIITPFGGTERLQFWNRDIDRTIDISWNGTAATTPPGSLSVPAPPGPDGLALLPERPRPYVVTMRDDPRVQFPGRELEAAPNSTYELRTLTGTRATWTAQGVDGDGSIVAQRPASLVLDRRAVPDVRTVRLMISSSGAATAPTRVAVRRAGRVVARGSLRPGVQPVSLDLPVPRCGEGCNPVTWTLRGTGTPTAVPYPGFGAAGTGRPVVGLVQSAALEPAP